MQGFLVLPTQLWIYIFLFLCFLMKFSCWLVGNLPELLFVWLRMVEIALLDFVPLRMDE